MLPFAVAFRSCHKTIFAEMSFAISNVCSVVEARSAAMTYKQTSKEKRLTSVPCCVVDVKQGHVCGDLNSCESVVQHHPSVVDEKNLGVW